MVGVTDAGGQPVVGSWLRRIATRLLVTAGLVATAWLIGAALGSGTAAAAEPSTPTTSPSSSATDANLLGTLAGSLNDTLNGIVGGNDVTGTLATVVGSVTSTAATTVTDVTGTVPTAVTSTVTTVTSTITGTRSAQSTPVTPVSKPAAPVVTQQSTHVVAKPPVKPAVTLAPHHRTGTALAAKTVAAPKLAWHVTLRLTNHHPVSPPLPVPAPQQPSPALPVTSVTAGHTVDSQARNAVAAYLADANPTALASSVGWTADPATLAARCQALPATSPD